MYDSESDLGSEDEEEDDDSDIDNYLPEQFKTSNKNKKKNEGTWIKETGEEAIDFLDPRVVSKVIGTKGINESSKQSRRNKKELFKRGKDGKMIINDEEDEENNNNMNEEGEENTEDYYMESVRNVDRFTRTPAGRIKFNKTQTKRGRNGEDNFDDESDDDNYNDYKNKKRAKGENGRIASMAGKNYKAKNASGDVKKKNQLDPYAYIPLNSKIVGNK